MRLNERQVSSLKRVVRTDGCAILPATAKQLEAKGLVICHNTFQPKEWGRRVSTLTKCTATRSGCQLINEMQGVTQ